MPRKLRRGAAFVANRALATAWTSWAVNAFENAAMQRRLRAEVLSHADGAALLDDADAALRLVRPRRPRRAHCSKGVYVT